MTAIAELGSSGSIVSSPLVLNIATAVAAPLITGAVATTGTVTSTHLTNAGTVTLSGTAEQGATIAVMDGIATVGTAIANVSGIWSDNVALVLGENTLTAAVSYDAAGNSSPASTALVLDAFSATPAVPTIAGLAAGSDSGAQGDNRTDITAPTFVGTGTPGDVVTLSSGSTILATGTVASTGTWSIAVTTPLAVGATSTLTATLTDPFGTVSSASAAYDVTIDPLPAQPVIALTSGTVTTDTTEPGFAITSSAGLNYSVTIYNGGTQIGYLAAPQLTSPAAFTPSAPLPIGLNTITAVASNTYGDVSNTDTLVITVRPVAPTLDPGSDSGVAGDNITNIGRPQIDGTAIAYAPVTILDNGGSIGATTAGANGTWTFTPSTALIQGVNTLVAMVTVGNGNTVASDPLNLTIQTAAPTPAITGAVAATGTITSNDLTNTGTVTLSGTAEQGGTVVVMDDGIAAPGSVVVSSGGWSEAIVLQQGLNTLTASISDDNVGNSSAASAALVLTAYPTPPGAPTITGLAAADTAGLGGSVTAINEPTLTGTGLAADTVTLLLGGTVIGTGTVGSGGTWSVVVDTPLAVGQNSITAEQADPFARISTASAAYNVTIETVSAPSLDAGSESGTSSSITNHTRPQIDGLATPNATIVLLDNGSTIGATTANTAGNWSVVPSAALIAGANTLVAVVGISNGLTVASAPFVLTIQTSAASPTITLSSGSDSGILGDDLSNDTTPTLTGTAAANATVALANQGTLLATVTASAGGAWSYTPTIAFASGTHLITGVATDVAGNISAAGSLTLNIETSVAAPTILSFSPNSGLVQANNDTGAALITLYGSAAAGSNIVVYDDGIQLVEIPTTTGQWSISAGPALGANTYTASIASDPAGNASALSTAFVVTRLAPPPAPTIIGLAPASDSGVSGDGITNVTTPTILGTGIAGDLVTLENAGTVIATGTVSVTGGWSLTAAAALASGTHTLTATLTDAADNVGPTSSTYQFSIDTTPPPAPTVVLNASSVNPVLGTATTDNRTPGLQGTATAGDLVTVDDGSTLLGTATATAGSTWSLTPLVPLPLGSQTITDTVTDLAGNISAAGTLALTITNVPTTAPTLTLAPASDSGTVGDQLTNVTEPELIGSAPAGDQVVISANSAVLGTVVATITGLWTYTPDSPLASGSYLLQAARYRSGQRDHHDVARLHAADRHRATRRAERAGHQRRGRQ